MIIVFRHGRFQTHISIFVEHNKVLKLQPLHKGNIEFNTLKNNKQKKKNFENIAV